jgi:Putative Flp pilus-assembly TadE/G-like
MNTEGRTMMHAGRDHAQGQTLVIVALAMIPLLLIVGLVIDGGYAFTQQRRTQNAMDAAADAGAVVIVQNLPFTSRGQTGPKTDSDVLNEFLAVAAANGVTDPTPTAVYTNIGGDPLDPEVVVGSLGGAPPPAAAYGIEARGSRTFGTFFGGIVGLTEFTASSRATAVAGAITNICSSEEPCGFIPVTFPTALTDCVNTGKQTAFGSGGPYDIVVPPAVPNSSNEIIIPLCGTENGSVGWLDILPDNPNCNGNGAAELACNIANPRRDSLDLPIWIATRTGNINSSQVQAALDAYSGNSVGTYEPGLDKIVQIPLYDCVKNNVGQLHPGPPCPNPKVNGVGSNTYYRIVAVAAMILDHSYIQGSNPECNQTPGGPPIGGNGMNGCLKGWLTQILTTGTVGLPTGTTGTVWGVQLIR